MCPPVYYADTERNQRRAHRVLWDFLGPYHDIDGRVAFWEQFYREQASAASTSESSTQSTRSRSPSVTSSPPSERPQPPVEQHPPQQQPPENDCYWNRIRQVPSVLPPEPHLSLSVSANEPSALPPHPFELQRITRRHHWVHSSSSESSAGSR